MQRRTAPADHCADRSRLASAVARTSVQFAGQALGDALLMLLRPGDGRGQKKVGGTATQPAKVRSTGHSITREYNDHPTVAIMSKRVWCVLLRDTPRAWVPQKRIFSIGDSVADGEG